MPLHVCPSDGRTARPLPSVRWGTCERREPPRLWVEVFKAVNALAGGTLAGDEALARVESGDEDGGKTSGHGRRDAILCVLKHQALCGLRLGSKDSGSIQEDFGMGLALRDVVPRDDMVEYSVEKLPVSLRLQLEVPPVGASCDAARNL